MAAYLLILAFGLLVYRRFDRREPRRWFQFPWWVPVPSAFALAVVVLAVTKIAGGELKIDPASTIGQWIGAALWGSVIGLIFGYGHRHRSRRAGASPIAPTPDVQPNVRPPEVSARAPEVLAPHERRLDDEKQPGTLGHGIAEESGEAQRPRELRGSDASFDAAAKRQAGAATRWLGFGLPALVAICLAVVAVGWLAMNAARGSAGLGPGPTSYADCVLAHVKPSMSKDAAAAVCAACREKFPRQPVWVPGTLTADFRIF